MISGLHLGLCVLFRCYILYLFITLNGVNNLISNDITNSLLDSTTSGLSTFPSFPTLAFASFPSYLPQDTRVFPLIQTAQKQTAYLCYSEIKNVDLNQWSLLAPHSKRSHFFLGLVNDSSSPQLWTEWDAEAEEDVGLCGGERQVHRTTPANKEERLSPNQCSILFTTTIQGNGTALSNVNEKIGENFIFSKSNFYTELYYVTVLLLLL